MTPCLRIAYAVSQVAKVTLDDLISHKKTHHYVRARQVAQYLCVHDLGLPLSEVGRQFARDHSTVSHALDAMRLDISNGGPRSIMLEEVRALLLTERKLRPYQAATIKPDDVMPPRVRRVTGAGWIEADGSLVVAP